MFWAFRRRFSYELRSIGSKFVCMNVSTISYWRALLEHGKGDTIFWMSEQLEGTASYVEKLLDRLAKAYFGPFEQNK